MQKLASLTVLRAVAAVSVVYYHVLAPTGRSFGEFGVDIFFVLSGFVIALVLAQGVTLREFIAARLARIVPLYWLLTVSVFIAAFAAPSLFKSTTADLESLLKSLLFIPYVRPDGKMYPLLFVGWTLNHEMFFYAAAALSLALAQPYKQLVTCLIFASVVIACALANSDFAIIRYFANFRTLEFLLGIAAWAMWRRGLRIPGAASVALAVAAYSVMAYMEWAKVALPIALRNGPPSFLLVLCLLSVDKLVTDAKQLRAVVLLGDASYAIYLSHAYVVQSFAKVLPKLLPDFNPTAPWSVALTLIASMMLGVLLYRLADQPLHRLTKRMLSRSPNH